MEKLGEIIVYIFAILLILMLLREIWNWPERQQQFMPVGQMQNYFYRPDGII